MNLRIFYVGIFLLLSALCRGQDILTTRNIVLYDPLFWKDQLKLDAFQCQKIKEINSEFYEKLSAVVEEEPNRKTIQVKAAQSLLQRSEEIWETFHPKQRKRWKKIWKIQDV
jgi:hypothetical protein